MNKVIHKLLFAALMCGTMTLTSCDEILGTEPDNPSNKVPDEVTETVELLEQAQQEGAHVAITFTYNGEQYQAIFKKVGNDYVLQDPSAARTRGHLVNPFEDMFSVELEVHTASDGTITFTVVDKERKCILQADINTKTCEYKSYSPNNQATLDDFSICAPEAAQYTAIPIYPTRNDNNEVKPTKAKLECSNNVMKIDETCDLKVAYTPTDATSFASNTLIKKQEYYICEYIVADGRVAQIMLSDKSDQSFSHLYQAVDYKRLIDKVTVRSIGKGTTTITIKVWPNTSSKEPLFTTPPFEIKVE